MGQLPTLLCGCSASASASASAALCACRLLTVRPLPMLHADTIAAMRTHTCESPGDSEGVVVDAAAGTRCRRAGTSASTLQLLRRTVTGSYSARAASNRQYMLGSSISSHQPADMGKRRCRCQNSRLMLGKRYPVLSRTPAPSRRTSAPLRLLRPHRLRASFT
ncbi:hypothetical protein IQ07DRAFT_92815 [Pyrenochaeta sp. DS3sAY3a]|nr:hypothetical protein IQ07DRAFT_92815 [Pyrenochaeta sp. DS3sAY3a]